MVTAIDEFAKRAVAAGLSLKEGSDGRTYVKCPDCSKLYGWVSDEGKVVEQEIPSRCKRCGCPMDAKKAAEFSEAQARAGHSPALAEIGNRLRGVAGPPVDKMVKAANTK